MEAMSLLENVKYAVYFVLLSIAGSASFAAEPPTSIDLKAAYCIGVSNASTRLYLDIEKMIPSFPLEKQDALRKDMAKRKDDFNRLLGYLIPRIYYLEPSALLIAQKRAETDLSIAKSELDNCLLQCADKQCSDYCFNDISDTRKRILSCNEISWLPF